MVAACLRSVRALNERAEFQRIDMLERYWRGTQYEDREYNFDGSYRTVSPGASPLGQPMFPPGESYVPLAQRCPPAQYMIGKLIVDRYSGLLFGKGRFPAIICKEDPVYEDFARATSEASKLPALMVQVRDLAGASGASAISYQWVDGTPRIEVHSAKHLKVLEWADTSQFIPAHVLKIWPIEEDSINAQGALVESIGWRAREWGKGFDRVYSYQRASGQGDLDRWILSEQAPLVGKMCPVVWVQNIERSDRACGTGDFEGAEGLIDAMNFVLCATNNGVEQNIDPTLILMMDPEQNTGAPIRKGGFNTIFSPGGAQYLQISPETAEAGLKMVDRDRTLILEQAHVANLDPEKMKGAQSGESLRRMMFATTTEAGKKRVSMENAIVRVLDGLAQQARAMPSDRAMLGPGGEPVIDATTGEAMREAVAVTFALPGNVRPGEGKAKLQLVWPEYFPDSAQDRLANVQTLQAANGGQPVIGPRTAVTAAAPMFDVADVDAEMAEILEHTRDMADARAGSIGEIPPSNAATTETDNAPPPVEPGSTGKDGK